MAKKKIAFVFGTRPEAVKMAPVIKEAEKNPSFFDILKIVTGQHNEMLDQILKTFDIKPDYDLKIMEEGQSLSQVAIKSLKGLEKIFLKEKPDIVVVQGDTTSAFSASLSAFYQKIPVVHIEAGLRTKRKYSPFPEEINRKLITTIADLHFTVTDLTLKNLLEEGIERANIYVTGNTVVDALYMILKNSFDLERKGLKFEKDKKMILLTAHRRENFGAPLKAICNAVKKLISKFSNILFVIPVHKNPEVQKIVRTELSEINRVILTDPLDYETFVHVMKESYLILTDSGGIQEEAPSIGKPVLVLRDVTERPEGVISGSIKVVGLDTERIVEETQKLLLNKEEYDKMSKAENPYGDGQASKRIVEALLYYFGLSSKKPEEFKSHIVEQVRVI